MARKLKSGRHTMRYIHIIMGDELSQASALAKPRCKQRIQIYRPDSTIIRFVIITVTVTRIYVRIFTIGVCYVLCRIGVEN